MKIYLLRTSVLVHSKMYFHFKYLGKLLEMVV